MERKWVLGGYVACACRDCFEVTIAPSHWSDEPPKSVFCNECADAGCPDYQDQPGMRQECQRSDAYGCEYCIDLSDTIYK